MSNVKFKVKAISYFDYVYAEFLRGLLSIQPLLRVAYGIV